MRRQAMMNKTTRRTSARGWREEDPVGSLHAYFRKHGAKPAEVLALSPVPHVRQLAAVADEISLEDAVILLMLDGQDLEVGEHVGD